MRIIQTKNYEESAKKAAEVLLAELKSKPDLLFGLATGETAETIYKNMIAEYEAGNADFSHARSVNLDEYVGCGEMDSYSHFMNTRLFDHINIPRENITIANAKADPESEVKRLRGFFAENRVTIQLLGIGPNGHVGFNEPDTELDALTHITPLTQATIDANARFFESADLVPKSAITMGMGDILRAEKILLVVKGESKKKVLAELLRGEKVNPENPATFLLLHNDVTLIYDESLV